LSITVPRPPSADFHASNTNPCVNETITFFDDSTRNPTSWYWTFGDGGTSTAQDATHSYDVAGKYTVSLTVSNAYGSDTKTRTEYMTVHACTTYYKDADGDGYGVTGDTKCLCAPSGDYDVTIGGDCDDTNASVYPGATEVCNGIDDDCDDQIDEEDASGCTTYYKDADGDGYGVTGDRKCLCAPSGDYNVTIGGDCDDTDADANPDAEEACDDGKDNDCDEDVDCDDSDCSEDDACKLGIINGVVFYDADGDGEKDPSESGIAGVTVELYEDDGDEVFDPEWMSGSTDALVDTMTTDKAGVYLFSDLELGLCYWVYVVEDTLPPGVTLAIDNPIGPICLDQSDPYYYEGDFPAQVAPLPPVGGTAYPVNKLAILLPWIALAAVIAGALIYMRRRQAES
jgi:PKD repeat protein